MKRIFDILLALMALICLFPIFAGVALMIYFHDYGPVIFRQRRVGLNGNEFTILKFRSMVLNAENLGGQATKDGDPRITRIGRFVRMTSLDELPQLVNVLRGEMSIVGPRPDVPAHRSMYSDNVWLLRHSVKPGITGLAQATVRSLGTMVETNNLDLFYVQHANLLLDIKIIFMTIKRLLTNGSN